jgi:hypothetical protein
MIYRLRLLDLREMREHTLSVPISYGVGLQLAVFPGTLTDTRSMNMSLPVGPPGCGCGVEKKTTAVSCL